ncbi:uncharacterized protein LOC123301508 isoform X2 [Chrysoperla carnea]|nr:uncharacterized protein LOC123301508 isoform X2 [Chrysoperla carnea]
MERSFNNGRSWQSLKEHYKKVLVNELHRFDFLTNEEIQSFRSKKYIPNIVPIVESSGQRLENDRDGATGNNENQNNEESSENNDTSFENNEVTLEMNNSVDRYAMIEELLCLECMEKELLATTYDTGFCVDCHLTHKITFENNQIKEIRRT